MNILTVHYTYVPTTTKAGGENRTFSSLKRIMDEDKSIVTVGHDSAMKIRCTPAIALNDFYPQGQDELVSQVRNEGGFVTILNDLAPEGIERNKFTVDALITNINRTDDDEQGTHATMRAAVFNFRGDILPVTFTLRSEDAISYFENLEPSGSEPIFTKIWGKIVSRTEIQKSEEESAFGEPSVDVKQRRVREWVVTGAAKETYEFGPGCVLTPDDIKQALANREIALADTKKRSEDYYNSRNTASVASAIPQGNFNF